MKPVSNGDMKNVYWIIKAFEKNFKHLYQTTFKTRQVPLG